jgi:hypothetical protein
LSRRRFVASRCSGLPFSSSRSDSARRVLLLLEPLDLAVDLRLGLRAGGARAVAQVGDLLVDHDDREWNHSP